MSGSSKAFAERFGTTLDDAALFLSRMHLVAAEVCDTMVQVRFPRRQAALAALSRGHERSLHSALLAEDSPGLTLPPSATFEPVKPVGITGPISVGRAKSFFRRHTKYALPCDQMTTGGASPDDVALVAGDAAPMEEEVHCFMVHPTLSVKLNTALRTVRPQGVRRTRALAHYSAIAVVAVAPSPSHPPQRHPRLHPSPRPHPLAHNDPSPSTSLALALSPLTTTLHQPHLSPLTSHLSRPFTLHAHPSIAVGRAT